MLQKKINIYILPANLIISVIVGIVFQDITGKERKESRSFPVEGGREGWSWTVSAGGRGRQFQLQLHHT